MIRLGNSVITVRFPHSYFIALLGKIWCAFDTSLAEPSHDAAMQHQRRGYVVGGGRKKQKCEDSRGRNKKKRKDGEGDRLVLSLSLSISHPVFPCFSSKSDSSPLSLLYKDKIGNTQTGFSTKEKECTMKTKLQRVLPFGLWPDWLVELASDGWQTWQSRVFFVLVHSFLCCAQQSTQLQSL